MTLSVPTAPHPHLFLAPLGCIFCNFVTNPPQRVVPPKPPNLLRTEIPPRDPETSCVKEGAGGGMQGASFS